MLIPFKAVDILTLKNCEYSHKGQPWRVLFAFDPIRQAIMLVGGNKTGNKRWYEKNIPITEKRFEAYFKTLTEEI